MSTAIEVSASRVRSRAARVAAAVLLAAAFAALAPSGASAATVCDNAKPKSYFVRTIHVHGKAIARVWMHWDASGRSCTVLRALKWKGTPHYMYLRVCRTRDRPNHGVGCSGWDAGLYSFYAGPIWHPQTWCQAIRAKIDSPSGRRVYDGWVSGPCD